MVIKALSTAGKTQGEISRQVGCSQCAVSKCLQGKSSGRKKCGRKRVTTKRDDRKLAKLVRSDWFQNCGEIAQQWNADGVPASRSTTYHRIKEMGYTNCISRVKPLLNFKQCKKWLTWTTEKRYWTVGQWSRVIFSDESKLCISFETEDHEFGGSPTKLTSPAARNPALNFHKAPWSGEDVSQQLELDLCVFCEQMSLLLSIKKSWSIFCFRRLSNCLEVTSSHSNTTWLLPIMPNPLRLKP